MTLAVPSNRRSAYDPKQILEAVATGISDRAVAAKLDICETTVARIRRSAGIAPNFKRGGFHPKIEDGDQETATTANTYRLTPRHTMKSDEAFAAALRGRTYGRLIFPDADARQPIHCIYRAPGDDISASGSSMLQAESAHL